MPIIISNLLFLASGIQVLCLYYLSLTCNFLTSFDKMLIFVAQSLFLILISNVRFHWNYLNQTFLKLLFHITLRIVELILKNN